MSNTKKTTLPLDGETLKWVLKSNPDSVSYAALVTAFGLNKETSPQLSQLLESLEETGEVVQDRNNRYASTAPLSDLVIATVGKGVSSKKRTLTIANLDEDMPDIPIYLSNKLIRKLESKVKKNGGKEGRTLKEGDTVAVLLERRLGVELHAKQLLGVVGNNSKLLVTAEFERAKRGTVPSQDALRVVYPNSRSAFQVASVDPSVQVQVPVPGQNTSLRGLFRARVPLNLDPKNPQLHVENRKWDTKTGMPVSMIVAHKNGLPLRHAPQADQEARSMTQRNFWTGSNRYDFRELRIMVIDPANAHDHDDGIYIESVNETIEGQRAAYRSLVVVPDVPFYVRPQSVIDTEARKRGFTHYFGNDALHMLPEIMPDKKVSLLSNRLRPVIFVEKYWDDEGNAIGSPEIGAAIIEKQINLSYAQFQNLCDNNDPRVWSYMELGDHLIEKVRHEKGIIMEGTGQDLSNSYAQALVAAMMQDANQEIAEFLNDKDIPFLRRAHAPKMNELAFKECQAYLERLGYEFADELEDLTLDKIRFLLMTAEERGERAHVEMYVRQFLIHQAHYTTNDQGHFALNMERYGHFTSPIRRYADILGLRAVHTALGNDDLGLSDEDIDLLDKTANRLNHQQQIAKNTALDFMRYKAISRLAGHEGLQRKATLGGVNYPYVHIDLRLPKNGSLRKTIHFQDLPDKWQISIDGASLIYDGTYQVKPEDALQLTISEVDVEKGEWSFVNLLPKPHTRRDMHQQYDPNVLAM